MFSISRSQLPKLWQIRHFYASSILQTDHYKVLGVSNTATQTEIRDAYYRLSMKYHPDSAGDASGASLQKFREISEAYDVLSNVTTRKLYDRGAHLKAKAPEGKYDPRKWQFYESRDEAEPTKYKGSTRMQEAEAKMAEQYSKQLYEKIQQNMLKRQEETSLWTNGRIEAVATICAINFTFFAVLNIIHWIFY